MITLQPIARATWTNIKSDGTAADDGDRVADFHAGFMQPAQNAGQRLSHGGIFKAHIRAE